jgi:hypothetical protein
LPNYAHPFWENVAAYWPFLNGGGASTDDESANENHIINFTNSPTWQGEQIHFTRASNQYLTQTLTPAVGGSYPSLDLVDGLTLFSEFRRDSINSNDYLISKHGAFANEVNASYGMACDGAATFFRFYVIDTNVTRIADFTASELNDTTSDHIVILTHDNQNAVLYIDGVFSQSVALAFTPDVDVGEVIIGALGRNASSTNFDGTINQTGVMNKAFSADEAYQLYLDLKGWRMFEPVFNIPVLAGAFTAVGTPFSIFPSEGIHSTIFGGQIIQ